MRKIFLLVCLLPVLSRAQNSYTVSNRPGVKANFYTLQGAVDSVPAGSTLYLFPSPVDYGNVNVSKKILIVGTGMMLDQNTAPFTNPNQEGVILSSVWFQPGSDGSYIQSVQLSGETIVQGRGFYRFLVDGVSNVTINRCMIQIWPTYPSGNIEIQTNNTTDCSFSQCYITGLNLGFPNHSGGEQYIELGNGSQNLRFDNNIWDDRGADQVFAFNHNIYPSHFGSVIFTNNTFYGNVAGMYYSHYSYFNNIFISVNPTDGITGNNGLDGNIGFNVTNVAGLFPAGSNTYLVPNTDSLFVNSTFGYHSFDQRWQVQAGSFAKKFANDGGEAGAYGGGHPYVLSGIPAFPNIYSVSVKPDSSIRGNMLVHIKAQATN